MNGATTFKALNTLACYLRNEFDFMNQYAVSLALFPSGLAMEKGTAT